MKAATLVRKLRKMDADSFVLLIEAIFYLAWARFLVRLPFAKIAPALGSRMKETPHEPPTFAQRAALKRISIILHMASRHTPWQSKCLVRAIAAMKMLERRKLPSTLYLGTAKGAEGGLIAHAWLRAGTYYVTGAEEMRKFTIVDHFAKGLHEAG